MSVFDNHWTNPEVEPIYKSDEHGVMAIADMFPRFTPQVVVLPRSSEQNCEAHAAKLSLREYLLLSAVSQAVGGVMLSRAEPGKRLIRHEEGFAVPDHVHIVLFLANRGDGAALYQRPNTDTSQEEKVVQEKKRAEMIDYTLDVVRFTPVQESILSAQLDEIATLRL